MFAQGGSLAKSRIALLGIGAEFEHRSLDKIHWLCCKDPNDPVRRFVFSDIIFRLHDQCD